MSSRKPAAPPQLPGYEALDLIGSGGYADVFLYRQERPERLVAMKVLVPEAISAGAGASDFTAEANLMAKVSSHPYIVQVFQADISPDGRPYLAMEYYPGANYYDRAKREQMTVADVLRTGIQLASAVETAHRANVYHRDIKPANVLTSEFHRPGLTDFGIASVQGPDQQAAEGLSIPWAPPEAFGDVLPDARGDVYSLAATIYTLLVGRSPYEIPGGDNSALSLMARVERNPVPAIGRADVPPSFERVLSVAMSKSPSHRPASAAEFGRQLQGVESELKLAVTPLELAGEARSFRSRTDVDADDDSTRVKGITEIAAQPTNLIRATGESAGGVPRAHRNREGMLGEPEVANTVARAPEAAVEPLQDFEPPSINRAYLWIGGAVATVALAVGAAFMFGGSGTKQPVESTPIDFAVNDGMDTPIAVAPAPVAEVVAVAGDGFNTFSWEPVGDDATYVVNEVGGTASQRTSETSASSTAECIEVQVVSTSGLISAATRGCI